MTDNSPTKKRTDDLMNETGMENGGGGNSPDSIVAINPNDPLSLAFTAFDFIGKLGIPPHAATNAAILLTGMCIASFIKDFDDKAEETKAINTTVNEIRKNLKAFVTDHVPEIRKNRAAAKALMANTEITKAMAEKAGVTVN